MRKELPPKSEFRHKLKVKVRFHEVDMLGVLNNAAYISFFEDARLEYIKDAGLIPAAGIFSDGFDFFMVRNEINYRSHAHFDDELIIHTRVSYIRNSSYGFEHLIEKVSTGEIIADGIGVVAQVDKKTGKAHPLSEEFRNKIFAYEGKVHK